MSEYIFSDAQEKSEYKRLSLLQDSFDEKSRKHLLKAGLSKGMHVLEVGLGLGSIASYMYDVVGNSGYVLGIDLNTHFIKEADYELIEGNIVDLEISQSFDIIHMRYVLIHKVNAKKIIEKLVSLLKPKGRLVIEEPDFSLAKWIDSKDIDGCKNVNLAICKMFELKGLKPYYGSVVHLDLESSGLVLDENISYLHLCSGGDDVANVMRISTNTLKEDYIQTGLCTDLDIDAYIQACSDEESLAVYYATIVTIAIRAELEKKEDSSLVCSEKTRLDGVYEAREKDDILECFEVMKLLRPHIERDSFVSNVMEQIKQGYQLFYLSKNSKLVCLAGIKIGTNLAWGKHLYVNDLVSSSSSLGYGKEMMQYVKSMAGLNNCKEIHLDSGVQRFEAHRFYLREGFKIASHHCSYKIEI
ncbi:GNAT family N-acetyltransferase [Sulfurimonas sp. MAG313]|nr:GNAT family N-acetyltransferase [Sulfurimonas sp. MAG313]MDF1880346.1 GNAT family N-acetyltransferase [Sulfurimonas sp. MAG313]